MSLLLLFNGGTATAPTYPLRWKLEMSTSTAYTSSADGWYANLASLADVTSDVRIASGVTAFWGQRNAGPTSRIAQEGSLDFTLNNSASNSAGLQGYYSPDNANCRAGFEVGGFVLLSWTTSPSTWTGATKKLFYITNITPVFGTFGERSTAVRCTDFIGKLGTQKLNNLPVQANKNTHDILHALLPVFKTIPYVLVNGTGLDTFPLVFHDITGNTTILNAIQRVVQSDLGYLFVDSFGSGDYESLVYQNRQARLSQSIFKTFDNSMQGLSVQHSSQNIDNYISVKSHPANTGASNETLWTLQREQQISAAQTITIKANFTDPSALGQTVRLSPGTGVTPVSGTHYKMWSAAGGGGSNISADLVVSVTFYAANAVITLTNNNAGTGYISNPNLFLQGKIIRLYDTVESISQVSADDLRLYGEHDLSFDMPYQDNPYTAQGFADYLLARYGSPNTLVESIEFTGNGGNESTVTDARIGLAISVKEDVIGINDTFWINGIELNITSANTFRMKFYCEPASSGTFWSLEETGYSELEVSTILGL